MGVIKWLRSVADMLLPRYCKVCGCRLDFSEEHLCVLCLARMPFCDNADLVNNISMRPFIHDRRVVHAASLFYYYKDSSYRNLIYHLKYYFHPSVGVLLGRMVAERLAGSGFFDGIDMIVTVPVTKRKLKKRGYNQCDYIARGISSVVGTEWRGDVIRRLTSGVAQAKKGRYERLAANDSHNGMSNPFVMSEQSDGLIYGKHILIVDDVLTTGATLNNVLSSIPLSNVRISIMTLGVVL